MNYKNAIKYLFEELPMYQKSGGTAFRHGLQNAETLSKILGEPEKSFPSIHIAGTNGKGSTAHFVASALQEAGYKVGLFTSPHLIDFRERMRIDGKMAPESFVAKFVSDYFEKLSSLDASFYEISFAMAMKYFADSNVDIAIIETGLGGRLDPTVLCSPIITVITNIGLDHTAILGDTIELIAKEKGGIVKHKTPLVVGQRNKKTDSIFKEICLEKDATIIFAQDFVEIDKKSKNFYFKKNLFSKKSEFLSGLIGFYQKENLATSYVSLKELSKISPFNISENQILNGFKNVINNTSILGRWQQINLQPKAICDTGHNVDGVKMIIKQLENESYENLHFVFGMVEDKDISGVLELLPKDAKYYFCKAEISRAMDEKKLEKFASSFELTGSSYHSVRKAYNAALENANILDLVFVGGSTFTVSEVL